MVLMSPQASRRKRLDTRGSPVGMPSAPRAESVLVSEVGEVERGLMSEAGSDGGEEASVVSSGRGQRGMEDLYPTWDGESHKTSEVVRGNPMKDEEVSRGVGRWFGVWFMVRGVCIYLWVSVVVCISDSRYYW